MHEKNDIPSKVRTVTKRFSPDRINTNGTFVIHFPYSSTRYKEYGKFNPMTKRGVSMSMSKKNDVKSCHYIANNTLKEYRHSWKKYQQQKLPRLRLYMTVWILALPMLCIHFILLTYKNNPSLFAFNSSVTIQSKVVVSNLTETERFNSDEISDDALVPNEGCMNATTTGAQHQGSENNLNESKLYHNTSDSNILFHVQINDTRTEETSMNKSNSTLHHVMNHSGAKIDGLIQVNKNDDIIIPLCTRQQILNGTWVPTTLPNGPPYVSTTKHLRCPITAHEDFNSSQPFETYMWQPNDSNELFKNNNLNNEQNQCQFLQWNTPEFCQVIPIGTILIIGDSLAWEQYSSLVQLTSRERVRQSHQFVSKTMKRNHIQSGCVNYNDQTRTKLVYRNEPRLSNETLYDSINKDFPIVIVLNRGAHYMNDTELMNGITSIVPVLNEWQDTCREMLNIECYVFYRTTVPGHPDCEKYVKPHNNIEDMVRETESLYNYNETTLLYHWYDFQRQNKLVLKYLFNESTNIRNLHVIDAYELGIRRPDGHRWYQGDCLHNCYPGTMDVYNQLLFHYLKMLRSPKDIQQLYNIYKNYNASTEDTGNETEVQNNGINGSAT